MKGLPVKGSDQPIGLWTSGFTRLNEGPPDEGGGNFDGRIDMWLDEPR